MILFVCQISSLEVDSICVAPIDKNQMRYSESDKAQSAISGIDLKLEDILSVLINLLLVIYVTILHSKQTKYKEIEEKYKILSDKYEEKVEKYTLDLKKRIDKIEQECNQVLLEMKVDIKEAKKVVAEDLEFYLTKIRKSIISGTPIEVTNTSRENSNKLSSIAQKALEFYRTEEYEKCIDCYMKILKGTEIENQTVLHEIYIYFNVGYCYLKLKDCRKALSYFNKIKDRSNKDKILWNSIGYCQHRLNKVNAAIDAYQKSIKLDQAYGNPWNGLGLLYYEESKYTQALECYLRAVSCIDKKKNHYNENIINPNIESLFVTNLIELYIVIDEYEKANNLFNEYVMTIKKDFRYYFLRYVCDVLQGNALSIERSIIIESSIESSVLNYSLNELKLSLISKNIERCKKEMILDLIAKIEDKRKKIAEITDIKIKRI